MTVDDLMLSLSVPENRRRSAERIVDMISRLERERDQAVNDAAGLRGVMKKQKEGVLE